MKRYVLPTVKMLLFILIAVSLTKIAFFPSQKEGTTADITPGFDNAIQVVEATTGDIASTVDVKGRIVEDAAVSAPATLTGTVDSLAVSKGDWVEAGAPLLYLKKTTPQEPVTSTDAEGNTTTTPQADKVTWATVYAPVAGTVSFNVIKDQETSVGSTVATISPGTYSAKGTISASQQYQLVNAPSSATLTVEGGSAPFTCDALRIGTHSPTSTTTSTDGNTTTTTGDGTSVEVRCPIPSGQKVFPGLNVTIGIDAGSATGAVLVPVTAVEGSVLKGNVWVVSDPAKPQDAVKKEVTLGINDGTMVQVTEGLAAGESVLRFVPGKDVQRTGTPNTCEDDGSACYDENGKEIL